MVCFTVWYCTVPYLLRLHSSPFLSPYISPSKSTPQLECTYCTVHTYVRTYVHVVLCHHTVQYSTVQYSTVLYRVQYCTVPGKVRSVLYNKQPPTLQIQYNTVLYSTVWCWSCIRDLYSTVLVYRKRRPSPNNSSQHHTVQYSSYSIIFNSIVYSI